MVRGPASTDIGILDIVGIGFGPSNLALAIAATEHNAQVPPEAALTISFLERQPRFGWHRGMLLDGATMQVSYLKDLVTLRNPASDFSYLSFLHDRNRLVDFINHKTMFPLRAEFHDYLEWAARRVDGLVEYDTRVVDIRPVLVDGEVTMVDVVAVRGETGETVVRRARGVVIAAGLEPVLPPGIEQSERVWHNHDLLGRVERLPSMARDRFVVVGAGQSAAEVTEFLHTRYPRAEVVALFSRYGYSPADNSAFANQIFDPTAVDDFYASPPAVKDLLNGYHRSTNYSVVDIDLIDELYRRVYQEKVQGRERLRIMRASRIAELRPIEAGVAVDVEFLPTGKRETVEADVIVFATGYRSRDPRQLLGAMSGYCLDDAAGKPALDRDYRMATTPDVQADLYVLGATEHSHGISSTLLSNVAVRAGELVRSMACRS
ncbi:lysine N(6)-hydroxylase/L-ornithine N(5)-oxygenase family protein [Frankia sp. AgB1.9]|uniref:lysine N(6)-hydroxylase/L-ornithine N(5)-oxygenase family protein n=1 Tax=unclassified Frankia TaxID=2632575 RepID=UPI001931DDAD|nr:MULTISPECIES: SidA/IucD/PvdA family monooxygenase [unclassified Frankia]MBL7492066.1 lysine N(6)-hydroxylase/L-ornithine N(5)-oxygenase family protein [Frankia sp. AgW1.1]MBL7550813.1 lysine N(6)-hydroxylase/L-ornithine N(5)-oxygenase family protein [Frankia sp. AgB1.9]MBL7625103.1 lysine N(6)-hydroxylase/L-ornithine N(5)-oxygenase family protein [Frankia sp. AgB1.8]